MKKMSIFTIAAIAFMAFAFMPNAAFACGDKATTAKTSTVDAKMASSKSSCGAKAEATTASAKGSCDAKAKATMANAKKDCDPAACIEMAKVGKCDPAACATMTKAEKAEGMSKCPVTGATKATTAGAKGECDSKATAQMASSKASCGAKAEATTASAKGECASTAKAEMASSKSSCSASKDAKATMAGSKAACASKTDATTASTKGECDGDSKYTLVSMDISGMTCGGCENAVKAALEQVDGVMSVKKVCHEAGKAMVYIDKAKMNDNAMLTKAVSNKGFGAEIIPAVAKSTDASSAKMTGKSCSATASEKAACSAEKKDAKMTAAGTK
ncbi:hypothetical protein GF420_03120 [candidate division GN15 bacterium]|nr:hypothetical protein [candidate division GN15 bacterium]